MLNREDFKIGIYPLAVMVYTTIFLSLVLLPKVKYSIPYIWNAGFCLLPVLIYVLKDKVNLYKIIVMVAVGILSGTLMWVQGNTVISDIINEPIRAVRYFVPCILLILINEAGRKQQIYVWCVASIILIYIGGLTLRELALNPMIARILANGSSDAELNQYRMMNIGGFGVSYGIGLTFPLWVSLFLR